MNTTPPIVEPPRAGNLQNNAEPRGLDFIDGYRSDLEFERAKRHSGIVKFLKYLLPVIAVLVIISIAGALVVQQMFIPDIDIAEIKVDDGKLVMENPKLNGVDENRRPYKLSANRAIQDAANPSVVELQEIIAQLPMDETVSADVVAGNGVYDADAKTLILKEAVSVQTSDGMKLNLLDADVDIANGSLVTKSPIQATSPQADISSASLLVENGGERLVFEGNVKMTLRPKELKNKQEQADAQNQ